MASVIGFAPHGTHPIMPNPLASAASLPLDRLIELEVIPRLIVAHPGAFPEQAESRAEPVIGPEEPARFARLALSRDAHALLEEAEACLARGIPAETLFVDLLAPAARILGRGWEDDSIDFVDVTMGLWRLQEVLREVAARSPPPGRHGGVRRALFAAMPGEQHSFGAAMVAECFARAGWDASLMIDASRSDVLAQVNDERLDLIGLTVSCDCHIERLAPLIAAIRNVSANPQLRVMIGGRVATLNPGLAAIVGADGSADTAIEAVAMADSLIHSLSSTVAG